VDPMQFHRYAWKLAHRYHDPRSIYDREDIYQAAMLAVLELPENQVDLAIPYCMVVMKNAVIDMVVKESKRRQKTCTLDKAQYVSDPHRVEVEVVERKATDIIHSLIEQLPDNEFALLTLKVNGANMKQVARDNGWCKFKTYAAVRRAKERLHSWMVAVEVAG
jgi:DNA-directed RNA polymerase specialized sigma24 family protein